MCNMDVDHYPQKTTISSFLVRLNFLWQMLRSSTATMIVALLLCTQAYSKSDEIWVAGTISKFLSFGQLRRFKINRSVSYLYVKIIHIMNVWIL